MENKWKKFKEYNYNILEWGPAKRDPKLDSKLRYKKYNFFQDCNCMIFSTNPVIHQGKCFFIHQFWFFMEANASSYSIVTSFCTYYHLLATDPLCWSSGHTYCWWLQIRLVCSSEVETNAPSRRWADQWEAVQVAKTRRVGCAEGECFI